MESLAAGKRKKRTGIAWKPLLKSAAIGTGVLVLSVLLLTVFVYLEWLPESAIPAGNTVIKVLTALAAGIAVGRNRSRMPWYYGGIAAVSALSVSVAAMSAYAGAFTPSWTLLADLLMCFAIGSAAAAVFVRRQNA